MPRRNPLRALLLDAGGTLLHEAPSRSAIYAEHGRAHGLAASTHQVAAAMARVHDELPRELGPHFRYSRGWFEAFIERVFVRELGLAPRALAPLAAELFARFEDPATFRLHRGAAELVRTARELGLRVGVVSNWSEALPRILVGLGLAPQLDFCVVSAVERCEKPEPRIFELALERADVNPLEAAHVGDCALRDVRGARALGILAVHVARDGAPPAPEADHTVQDLIELDAWMRARATT